ncbi:MAG: metallophosphoesterase [Salinivirgaceae bacterium]
MMALILFIALLLVSDFYSWIGLRTSLQFSNQTLYHIIYAATTLISWLGMGLIIVAFSKTHMTQPVWINLIFGLAFSLIVAKLIMGSFFLIEDILRGFVWLFQTVANFRTAELTTRSFFWGLSALTLGGLLALFLNYGVIFGKYHYKVHKQTLYFDDLPDAFHGFKIVQLSDLHLGTFDNAKKVAKGLKIVQQQEPDLLVFTGDMVNNYAYEALPYIDGIKELQAPYGKYTIMGNHDYGSYARWNSEQAKTENLKQLHQIEKEMGLTWLNNQQVALTRNSDTIYLIGVENWGLPPFPQYGELDSAVHGIPDGSFAILLSHDPTHWRQQVLDFGKHIHLTLSGHTHGMQFGFELGKLKWSPVKYKYAEWAGLYETAGKYLNVNRGFGHIGYPGRAGIRPEITVIELKKRKLQALN